MLTHSITKSQPATLALAKRALHRFPTTAQHITCRSGTLWITQDHDLRDIILEPGESFTSDGHHAVIAYALNPATLSVAAVCKDAVPQRSVRRSPAAPAMALE